MVADDRNAVAGCHVVDAYAGCRTHLLVHIEKRMPVGPGERCDLVVRAITPEQKPLAFAFQVESQMPRRMSVRSHGTDAVDCEMRSSRKRGTAPLGPAGSGIKR